MGKDVSIFTGGSYVILYTYDISIIILLEFEQFRCGFDWRGTLLMLEDVRLIRYK